MGLVETAIGHVVANPLAALALAVILPLSLYCLKPKRATDPPTFPFLAGVFLLILGRFKDPVQALLAAWRRWGVFTLTFPGGRVTILSGPEHTAPFFKAPDSTLDQTKVYAFTSYVFGEGVLYDLTPQEVTHQLKNLSHALSAKRMRTYADTMVKEAREFFAEWPESGEVDLRDEMARLIINTASRCLLGKEIRELLHERVAELYHHLDSGLTPLSFFAPWLPTPAHRRRDAARKEMEDLFRPFIQDRRAGKTVGDDFLQTLIDSRNIRGEPYTDQQITGMLLLALFAGQHTSSVTATWTGVLMMLDNTRLMDEVLREQQEVFGKHNGQFNWDSLGELRLLGQCIKEALRMFPPLLALMRKAMKPIAVPGTDYVIPEGDIVVVSPCVCNRLETVYTDPDTFDAHRWDPDLEALYPPFSHTAFGGGRHGCMGENFAYLQVKAIWSEMIQQFEWELVKSERPKLDFSALVVAPEYNVMVKFRRRKTPLLKMPTLPPLGPSKDKRHMPADDLLNSRVNVAAEQEKLAKKRSGLPTFTAAEVAKHNVKEDLWVIVRDNGDAKGKAWVYDITKYVKWHKGGEEAILRKPGGDITEMFFGDQHPRAAAQILEEYIVGGLKE